MNTIRSILTSTALVSVTSAVVVASAEARPAPYIKGALMFLGAA